MFFSFSKKLFALLSIILLSSLFTGCGVWRNFTSYFNTFYNIKTLFDQTEEAYLKQRTDIFKFREDQQNTLQTGQYGQQQYGTNQQYGTQQYGGQQQQYGNQQQYGSQQHTAHNNMAVSRQGRQAIKLLLWHPAILIRTLQKL